MSASFSDHKWDEVANVSRHNERVVPFAERSGLFLPSEVLSPAST